MATTKTPGQNLTATLRTRLHVGPRTRDYRDRKTSVDGLKDRMLEIIENAAHYDGWYSPEQTAALRPGIGAVRSHRKHVEGYRIDGETAYRIGSMSPWAFSALLGEMVDAGITNVGQGETFYRQMRAQVALAA